MAKDMRIGAWLFLASLPAIFLPVPLGNFFFTLPSTISAVDLAAHYRENTTGILLFSLAAAVAALLWMFYIPAVAVAMMRMRNASWFLVIIHIITGSIGVISPFMSGVFFSVAALHPEMNPQIIQVLHDVGKMFYVTSLPVGVDGLVVATAISRDDPAELVFPRWLAVINIAYAVGAQVNLIAIFVRTGPLGLNGAIGLWLPLVLVAIHIVGTTVAILRVPAWRWDNPSAMPSATPRVPSAERLIL